MKLMKVLASALFTGVLAVGMSVATAQTAEAAGYRSKPSSSAYRAAGRPSSLSRSRASQNRYRPSAHTNPRRYSAPRSYSAPRRNTTVINKHYNTTNYGNRGGYGGGGMGGSGLGTSLIGGAAGAVGGMMLYDALKGPSAGDKALQEQRTQQQIDNAVQDQMDRDQMERIEQKLDQQQQQQRQVDPYFQLNPNNI